MAAEADLLGRPGVNAIDVGFKYVGGSRTGDIAIRVLVQEKKDVSPAQKIPAELAGVKTDVIQRSFVIHAPGGPVVDPVLGGISIGPCRTIDDKAYVGTLGCIVLDNATGAPMLLSNFHVLAVNNDWRPGDAIAQPSRVDGGACPENIIAVLERAILSGSLDGAVAKLKNRGYSCEIFRIGMVAGAASAMLGEAVRKTGRSTGLTFGSVDSIDLTVSLDYGPGVGVKTLRSQIGIHVDSARSEIFGEHGDSGSLVVRGDRVAIGLYCAGSTDGLVGVANPIQAVLDALGVRLCGAVESGGSFEERLGHLENIVNQLLTSKEIGTMKHIEKSFKAEKPEKFEKHEKFEKPEKDKVEKHEKNEKLEKEKHEKPEHKEQKPEFKEHKPEFKEHKPEFKEHKPEFKEHKPEFEKPFQEDQKIAQEGFPGPVQPSDMFLPAAGAAGASSTGAGSVGKALEAKSPFKEKFEKIEKREKIEKPEKIEKIEKNEKQEKEKREKPEFKEHKPEFKEHKPEWKEIAKEHKPEFEKVFRESPKELVEGGLPGQGGFQGPIETGGPAFAPAAGAASTGVTAAKIIEKPFKEFVKEKPEKFEKLEKLEKHEKFEKHEKLEKDKHEKLEFKEHVKSEFEKPIQEVDPKGIAENLPGTPGQIGPDPTLNQRLANLEAAVSQLTHFIPKNLRPDLSQGALSQEPDTAKPPQEQPQQTPAPHAETKPEGAPKDKDNKEQDKKR